MLSWMLEYLCSTLYSVMLFKHSGWTLWIEGQACDSEAFLSLLRPSEAPQPQLTVRHFVGDSK